MRIGMSLLAICVWVIPELWADEDKAARTLPRGFAAAKGSEADPASSLPMRVVCLKDGSEMVLVPAGEFAMGSERGEKDERPVHKVMLDAFYIDVFEVSNTRYRKFMAETDASPPGSMLDENLSADDQPVLLVSRAAADEFCRWSGKRLPTEAEWEKAARGSSDTRMYPWGNESPDCSRLNFHDGTHECVGDTAPVGSYPSGQSPYGVMDMAGNVAEWVNDWYQDNYYSVSPSSNPPGPAYSFPSVMWKVSRGGLYYYQWHYSRTARRLGTSMPDSVVYGQGFRCARTGGVAAAGFGR